MTTERMINVESLRVDPALHEFIEQEALPGTGVSSPGFWQGLSTMVHTLGPRNRELLITRNRMQLAIDAWHLDRNGRPHDPDEYRSMLRDIGYLVDEGDDFEIEPTGVDPEIANIAGPQLIVPVTNARYALNAANARWGSLYDALYGTDALGTPPPDGPYRRERGGEVVAWVRQFLDDSLPLRVGSHRDVIGYVVEPATDGLATLVTTLADGRATGPIDASAFVGFTGSQSTPTTILLEHHGLGIEIAVDRNHPVGASDLAGVCDVLIESAVTVVMDFEDSVATVDGSDKVAAYRNWLGMMRGDLAETVTKNDSTFVRRLADDRRFTAPDGSTVTRRGRSLLLARNVGHLMTTPAVIDRDGHEAPEGLLDAIVTVLAAMHDLGQPPERRNSPAGSVYIVKPKMHGPEEVAFTDDIFTFVEQTLGLPVNTVKIGIMDEERRTSVNLKECIRVAKARVAFINTGFLDRTGDEIHTSMQAGPMVRKAEMKSQPWIRAYEDWNVDVGLACGLRGKAQIGKGMWAAPDLMAEMLREKIAHPLAGASCAWVPSPTAATLHATHYHRADVHARQTELLGARRATLDDLLTIPVELEPMWSEQDKQAELDNNVQGILGYVVRWVDLGIGCSKVPDIDNVALMEDRATCRISSQHIANWLRHGIVTTEQVDASLRRMAQVVDRQNAGDPKYVPMSPNFDGTAFRAASDLILLGVEQPSGYTEPTLHRRRIERKAEILHGLRS